MPRNLLLTGAPRVGKTTTVRRVVARFDGDARGLYAPEMREDGDRVGFDLMDVATGETWSMARVGYGAPTVGKYGVDVGAVDTAARSALTTDADLSVVDEIAPMQVQSDVFVRRVRETLGDETPLLGVVQSAAREGFIGEVKDRDDVRTVEVTRRNRHRLPDEVLSSLDRWRQADG